VGGQVVQDHLPADRGGAHQPGDEPQVGQAVLQGQAVAAVGLDGLVERGQRGVGRGQLGDVGRLGGVLPGVEQLGGPRGGQPGQLDVDVGFGQRVRDALVGADRLGPDLPLPRVPGRLADRVPADAVAQRGGQDPFGVEAGEDLPEARAGRCRRAPPAAAPRTRPRPRCSTCRR
jgi:hypothetical protein